METAGHLQVVVLRPHQIIDGIGNLEQAHFDQSKRERNVDDDKPVFEDAAAQQVAQCVPGIDWRESEAGNQALARTHIGERNDPQPILPVERGAQIFAAKPGPVGHEEIHEGVRDLVAQPQGLDEIGRREAVPLDNGAIFVGEVAIGVSKTPGDRALANPTLKTGHDEQAFAFRFFATSPRWIHAWLLRWRSVERMTIVRHLPGIRVTGVAHNT